MIVYPAMDLMDGRVVRLRQGRFEQATTYPAAPADALRAFADAGAQWAHLVDLDGARAGRPAQHGMIARLAGSSPLKLQVGGGFRTGEQVARMLDGGVDRVVVGSLAVTQPDLVRAWLDEFGPDRIALSLDVRIAGGAALVALSGWAETSAATLWDVASLYPDACHLLLTDIGRDGMLAGPNFDLLDEAVERLPNLRIQASGGVSGPTDLDRLRTDGVIIGRALWEGRIRLEEAIERACA